MTRVEASILDNPRDGPALADKRVCSRYDQNRRQIGTTSTRLYETAMARWQHLHTAEPKLSFIRSCTLDDVDTTSETGYVVPYY